MMRIMADKLATTGTYCVSGALVCGGTVTQWFSNIDWNNVAVASGIVIGVLTYLTNLYYKRVQRKDDIEMKNAYLKALGDNIVQMPPTRKSED